MRRKLFPPRRRFALRWHRTQEKESGGAGEGCAYGCLVVAVFWTLGAMLVLVLVRR